MNIYLKFLAELVGTFIFLSVILATGKAIPIGLALILVILVLGKVSGGHFNPAVSSMFYVKGDLDGKNLGVYIIAQIIGGVAAVMVHNRLKK